LEAPITATKIGAGRTWQVNPVHDHWHSVIAKQLVAARMGLRHGDRQRRPTAVQPIKARVAIPVTMALGAGSENAASSASSVIAADNGQLNPPLASRFNSAGQSTAQLNRTGFSGGSNS
jgi:hypothetical protein